MTALWDKHVYQSAKSISQACTYAVPLLPP